MLAPVAARRSAARSPARAPVGCLATGPVVFAIGLVLLLVLALPTLAFGQTATDDDSELTSRRGLEQLDRLKEKFFYYGKIALKVVVVLGCIIALKIISPFQRYQGTKDRFVERAVRPVGELVKHIQKEAQETAPEPQEEVAAEEGVLAGMTEIAELSEGEQVPPYVLTVNDLMLDNIRITLKRLRRFKEEGHAPRYRGYMFAVLRGIKTITEECITSGAPSSLAVDVEEYFRDERRYKAWNKLLSHMKHEGENQEVVDTFLLFIRNIKEGRPLVDRADDEAAGDTAAPVSPVPQRLNEETLPVIQKAAVEEAKNLIALVRKGQPLDVNGSWQFELVRRQQQLRLRDEAQRMLKVFLSCQRKTLPRLIKTRMLPCRTWPHVLHLLGVETALDLARRVEDRLLTIQEIVILQKAFLQTFAKRSSLQHVYGHGQEADLMIEMHIPQIRRESLGILRRVHETEPNRFDRATGALNEEETPQRNQVAKLMEHYVHHRNEPPGIG